MILNTFFSFFSFYLFLYDFVALVKIIISDLKLCFSYPTDFSDNWFYIIENNKKYY